MKLCAVYNLKFPCPDLSIRLRRIWIGSGGGSIDPKFLTSTPVGVELSGFTPRSMRKRLRSRPSRLRNRKFFPFNQEWPSPQPSYYIFWAIHALQPYAVCKTPKLSPLPCLYILWVYKQLRKRAGTGSGGRYVSLVLRFPFLKKLSPVGSSTQQLYYFQDNK
jgi:hypothetical protein